MYSYLRKKVTRWFERKGHRKRYGEYMNKIINREDNAVVASHWKGEKDIFQVVQKTLESANKMVGGGIWRRIKRYFR